MAAASVCLSVAAGPATGATLSLSSGGLPTTVPGGDVGSPGDWRGRGGYVRGGAGDWLGAGDVVRGRASEYGDGLGVCAWAVAAATATTSSNNDGAEKRLFINKYPMFC